MPTFLFKPLLITSFPGRAMRKERRRERKKKKKKKKKKNQKSGGAELDIRPTIFN